VSDDLPDGGLEEPGAAAGGYEPPKLSIYEHEAPAQWAALREGEDPPDDLLYSAPESDESPEVLGWSAPRPEYELPDPEVFAAPADPKRRVSGEKKVPKKTKAAGKVTRAHTTRTKLTGRDAFGGTICTCNLVCTCNQVCTCESVAECSCVSDSGGGGGGGACTCDAVCTCDGVSSCTCQSDEPSCQAQPY